MTTTPPDLRVVAGLLDRLRPDVIVTQDQCEVCAASLADVRAAVCELVESAPRIVSLEPGGRRPYRHGREADRHHAHVRVPSGAVSSSPS